MALGLVFAPAPPADREAVALQGRAERAGACDAPLAARPALAVAIPLSFASPAKAQRRRREQEIGPNVEGFDAQRPPTNLRLSLSLAREPKQSRRLFGAHANLQSIRSLNRSGPINSDHSLDATEFLRRSFGPWTRTQTTRPFFKFSCSNGSTAPRTWRDFTSCRSNRLSSRIWRLCGVGVGSGAWGANGSTSTRPGQSRRSSSRNGSIVRGAADTTSGTDSPASGFRRTARPAMASLHGVGNSYRRLTCGNRKYSGKTQGSRRTAGSLSSPAVPDDRQTAKLRPERALIKAPAEHREGRTAIIRRRHSGRLECANSGHSVTARERVRSIKGDCRDAAGLKDATPPWP